SRGSMSRLVAVAIVLAGGAAAAQDFAQPPPDGNAPPPASMRAADVPLHHCALVEDLEERADEPPQQALGLRICFCKLPVDHRRLLTMWMRLGVEHGAFGSPARPVRVFGELEWVWLGIPPADSEQPTLLSGSGTRASVGLRRALADTTVRSIMRF